MKNVYQSDLEKAKDGLHTEEHVEDFTPNLHQTEHQRS